MTRLACLLGLGLMVGTLAIAWGGELTWPSGSEPPKSTLSVDRIEAKEIVIRDQSGAERASLGVGPDNVVTLVASSGKGRTDFMIRVFPDGRGALIFRDASGVNRVGD